MEFNEDGCMVMDISPFTKPGVFVLLDDGDVVYVGRSSTGIMGVANHLDKKFDKVAFIECGYGSMGQKADELILKYRPRHNKKLCMSMTVKRVRDSARYRVVNAGVCSEEDAGRIGMRAVESIMEKMGIEGHAFNGSAYVSWDDANDIIDKIVEDFRVMAHNDR